MRNTIHYQNFDKEFFEEEYEDISSLVEETLELAKQDGSYLYDLFSYQIRWISLKIANGETDRKQLTHYFKLAMQGIYGHIKTLDNKGEPVKLWIDDKQVELSNTSTGYDKVSTLLSAFTYASICRSQEVLDVIFSFKENSDFLNYDEHENNPTFYLLKMHKNPDSIDEKQYGGYKELVENYWDRTSDIEFVEKVGMPFEKLLKEYFLGTEDNFNKYLKEALDKDKQYQDTTEDNRFRQVDGWLPWGIISIAARAYEKGWEITVEDPRLPMFLVKGECKVPNLAP